MVNLSELVPVDRARHNHQTANVTALAYTQVIAATAKPSAVVEIQDNSGLDLIVAIGAPGSEVIQIYSHQGERPVFRNWKIPMGSRVSIKCAQAAETTVAGSFVINLYG
jgi:hypothetical protein